MDEVVVCAVVEDAAMHAVHCLLARADVAEDAVEAAAVARSNATHQHAPVRCPTSIIMMYSCVES